MMSWYIFLNRTPQNHLPELQGRQIFTPPAMRGTSGQAYTDNIINFFKNLFNLCLPYEMFTPFNSKTI